MKTLFTGLQKNKSTSILKKLIRQFFRAPGFIHMASYKGMVCVFSEQFIDNDGKTEQMITSAILQGGASLGVFA